MRRGSRVRAAIHLQSFPPISTNDPVDLHSTIFDSASQERRASLAAFLIGPGTIPWKTGEDNGVVEGFLNPRRKWE